MEQIVETVIFLFRGFNIDIEEGRTHGLPRRQQCHLYPKYVKTYLNDSTSLTTRAKRHRLNGG